jgi:hypothetical protein
VNLVSKHLDTVINEVKEAIVCANSQEGQALSCTSEWLEMILEELEDAKQFRRLL